MKQIRLLTRLMRDRNSLTWLSKLLMLCGQYAGLFYRFILLILGCSLITSLTISHKKRSGGFLKKDFRDRLFVLTFVFQFLAQFNTGLPVLRVLCGIQTGFHAFFKLRRTSVHFLF